MPWHYLTLLLRAADLLGLPPGVPDPVFHVALHRYVLAALAVVWAAAVWTGRRHTSLALGVVHTVWAVGFWVLVLGRPYGLFVEGDATARAAEVAVVADTGRTDESFLAAEPRGAGLRGRLGPLGSLGLLVPTLLPMAAVPLMALLLHLLGGPRGRTAALLWLAFSTGALEASRGFGFVSQGWSHPGAILKVVVAVALIAAAQRTGKRPLVLLAAVIVVAGGLMMGAAGSEVGPATAFLALTFDQGIWFLLALAALRLGLSPGAGALLAAGGALLALSAVLPLDAWAAHALYRVGLLWAAAGPVERLAAILGERVPRRLWSATPLDRGAAVLLLAIVPGSFLSWWDPPGLDPVARASQEPVSPAALRAMAEVRRIVPAGATVAAGPSYAAEVAVLAGRRVLRTPGLAVAGDDERRARLERLILAGEPLPPHLAGRYRVSYVFLAPGDFRDQGLASPDALRQHPRFRLRYEDGEGLRLYERVD